MNTRRIFFIFLVILSFFFGHNFSHLINTYYSCIDFFLKKPHIDANLKEAQRKYRGIVVDSKRIMIEGMDYPYNASLTKGERDNFFLFFRYDVPDSYSLFRRKYKFRSHIGVVELDENFNQEKPFKILNTKSFFSEDPRVFWVNDDLFITYNDLLPLGTYYRSIKIASIDKDTFEVKNITDFDQYIKKIEKNWMVFTTGEKGREKPFFVYQINPHKILEIKDINNPSLNHLSFEKNPYVSNIKNIWSNKWGEPRGGTPPLLVDGRYLSFFHSFFKDKKRKYVWYVMGAYAFEPIFPFRITAISRYPIMFRGIYDTKKSVNIDRKKYCIYPAGCVSATRNGKDVFFVSCGENDSGIKILTIDKDELFKSLKKIKYE